MIKEAKIKEGRDVMIGERYGNIANTFLSDEEQVQVYMYDTRKMEIVYKRHLEDVPCLTTFYSWMERIKKVNLKYRDA